MPATTSLRRQIAGFIVSGILASAVYSGGIVALVKIAGLDVMLATAAGVVSFPRENGHRVMRPEARPALG